MNRKFFISICLFLLILPTLACSLSAELTQNLLSIGLSQSEVDSINAVLAPLSSMGIVLGCTGLNTGTLSSDSPGDADDFIAAGGQDLVITVTNSQGQVLLSYSFLDGTPSFLLYSEPQPEGSILTAKFSMSFIYGDPPELIETILLESNAVCGQSFGADGDSDGDGVINSLDNCPLIANPSQEDGWGGKAGDICEQPYDNGNGVKIFQQKDNAFNVHANCRTINGRTECPMIASIPPSQLLAQAGPQRFQSTNAEGWYVEVYYLGQENGQAVYQVNVYAANGTLQDDHLEILLAADGSISWRKQA